MPNIYLIYIYFQNSTTEKYLIINSMFNLLSVGSSADETYSLIRVTASSNSIVIAIVNSDAYHKSPLIDKWESMLYV